MPPSLAPSGWSVHPNKPVCPHHVDYKCVGLPCPIRVPVRGLIYDINEVGGDITIEQLRRGCQGSREGVETEEGAAEGERSKGRGREKGRGKGRRKGRRRVRGDNSWGISLSPVPKAHMVWGCG
jgi:hypothetical protein